jgi:nondiscriminating glutamyl-tRNA synthetase
MISMFDISRVQSKAAIFDIEKLNWMNGEYIRSYDVDKLTNCAFFYAVQRMNLGQEKAKELYVIRVKF